MKTHQEKVEAFLQLHRDKKLLILPNIWNPMGAMLLEDMNFPAVATASYAMAWDYGVHDGERIPLKAVLDQFRRIAAAVSIPVTVDFEKGYADGDKQLAQNIRNLIDIGIVGINIEDIDEQGNLSSVESLCHKIAVIKKTAFEKGTSIFINARTDAFLQGDKWSAEEKLKVSLERGKAYRDAGADCIYPMFMKKRNHIERMVDELKIPINIKAFPGALDLKTLEEMGVARISIGSAMFNAVMERIKNLAADLKHYKGIETPSGNGIPSAYLNGLLDR